MIDPALCGRVSLPMRAAPRGPAEFGSWLDTHFTLGAQQFSDLLLAVNEAIANAAEFAYADASHRGTMDVTAAYDLDSDILAVTVNYRGHWRQNFSAPPTMQARGRGIQLMLALADEVTIDRTPQGTHVTMTWTDLTR